MAGILGDNAIGWAQFRLLGGWKNMFATCTTYAVIATAVLAAMVKGVDAPSSAVYGYFIPLFLGLQVLALPIFGTIRVGQSVRADVAGKLLESHRLMPTPPAAAVLGYLFGSTAQALSFAAMNFAFGVVCTAGAGLRLQSWLMANGVLLLFSVFVWSITLFFAFRSGVATMGILIGLTITAMARIPLIVVPAAGLLFSPAINGTIFDSRIGIGINMPHIVAGLAQGGIATLFLVAATRRYRHDDVPGFDAPLGLLMLVIWTLISVAAYRFPDLYPPWTRRQFGIANESVFVGSACSVMLVALLPVSGAVRAFALQRPDAARRPAPPIGYVVASILVASCVVFSLELRQWPPFHIVPPTNVLRTVAVIGVFLAGARYVFGAAYRLDWGPRKVMVAWLLATWGLPLAVEGFRSALVGDPNEPLGQLAMCSPPTEIYQLWSRDPKVHTERYGGLAVQVATAAVAAIVYYALKPRRRATAGATGGFPVTTPAQTPVPPPSVPI